MAKKQPKLTIDPDRFDDQQNRFVAVLLDEVMNTLGTEIDPPTSHDNLMEVTRAVVWTVTNLLDGTRKVTGKNKDLIPHLTFSDGKQRKALIADPSGSSMHEYVHGWCEEWGMLPE